MAGNRRSFLTATAAAGAGFLATVRGAAPPGAADPPRRRGPASFKVGCCAYSLRRYLAGKDQSMTMEDFVAWAADVGCDGVELTSYYFPPKVERSSLHRVKRQAFLLGLDVAGTAVGNNFCLPPGPERDTQVAMVKTWIDNARELGAPCMRIFAGGPPRGASEEEARGWIVECIRECCAYAADRGVVLALENHGGLTADAAGTLKIVEAIASPWFGLNLDTGNFHGQDPYAEIAAVAPHAVTTHVKAMVSAAGKPSEPADFGRILSILAGTGYRGYLSLEYEERGEPREASAEIIRRLKEQVSAAR